MGDSLDRLKQRLGQVADIGHAIALANWDRQTMMPASGGQARAESLATLSRMRHELFTDAETGRLAHAAAAELGDADPDGDDARLITHVIRRFDKSRRVTPDLAADRARAAAAGQAAWVQARRDGDFAAFAPYLQHNIDLAHRYVECQLPSGEYAGAYDVMLDDFEPGMPSAQVGELFADLGREIRRLIDRVAGAEPLTGASDVALDTPFPVDAQRALVAEVLGLMGFDPAGWRMDDTIHPFAVGVGLGDVRLTTRFDERWFPMGLYGAMHECGHGLYEDGIPRRLRRSPLGRPESLALHESQSRLWENLVGRGRPFCEVLAPRIARLAGGRLGAVTADGLYRAVNRVRPSLIRVEADETTYGLHIVARYELERALIDGTLSVRELPAAFNERITQLLGVPVDDDANGVLQDVHWSAGLFGYFPTYALGNLIATQLWERARAELPDLDARLRAGELAPLRGWLEQHVYRHGAKFAAQELVMRETGQPIRVAPFIRYLEGKLGDVYGVDLSTDPGPTSER